MRLLRTILVILVLFALPVVSWFYLRQGLNWRKGVVKEVSEQLPFSGLVCTVGVENLDSTFFKGHLSVIFLEDPSVPDTVIKELYDQFGERKDIWFVILADDSPVHSTNVIESNPQNYFRVNQPPSAICRREFEKAFGREYNAALIDRSAMLRKRYDLSEVDEVQSLIRHITVMIPVEKREKLDLKYLKNQEEENGE